MSRSNNNILTSDSRYLGSTRYDSCDGYFYTLVEDKKEKSVVYLRVHDTIDEAKEDLESVMSRYEIEMIPTQLELQLA